MDMDMAAMHAMVLQKNAVRVMDANGTQDMTAQMAVQSVAKKFQNQR